MPNSAVLDVKLGENGSAELHLVAGNGDATVAHIAAEDLAAAQDCARRLTARNLGDGTEGPVLLAREFAARAVPEPVARLIRGWTFAPTPTVASFVCERPTSSPPSCGRSFPRPWAYRS